MALTDLIAGAMGTTTQQDEETPTDQQPPQPTLEGEENGELPAPLSNVAKQLAKVSKEEQRVQVESMWDFLGKSTKDLNALNADHLAIVLLVIVPGTASLRAIHSLGFGTQTFMTVNPVAGKILGLVGDGDTEIEPDSVVLPPAIFNEVEYLVPTDAQAEDSVENGSAIAAKDVTEKEKSMMAVPLPAYLVYDGLAAKDVDARVLYNRLELSMEEPTAWSVTAQTLAKMAMVRYRMSDTKPHMQEVLARVPPAARKWGKAKFQQCFPDV